ncbi:MAG TPA: hypothetical protein VFB62_23805 [Polyangiaceae bacterium]|nr:hypothetical protein [Polyangiaceae bacterium]
MRCLLLFVLLSACNGASSELGLDAWLRIEGAQYEPSPIPSESGGPSIAGTELSRNIVRPGEVNRRLKGALDPEGNALAIGLEGDRGHWIVTAGPPDAITPDLPSFDIRMSFSHELPLGPHVLVLRAFDARGRGGPSEPLELTAMDGPLAEGTLVVSLTWDTNADLDLHVVDPLGVEIHKGNINSWEPPPPGESADPDAYKSGAVLDFDSNAQCVIDGRRQENVAWPEEPPPGRYTVRVDTYSLCEETVARWAVDVWLHGALHARAEGTSTPLDAAEPHGLGAGQLALEVDVP